MHDENTSGQGCTDVRHEMPTIRTDYVIRGADTVAHLRRVLADDADKDAKVAAAEFLASVDLDVLRSLKAADFFYATCAVCVEVAA